MDFPVATVDLLGFVAFAVAFGTVWAIPILPESWISHVARQCMLVAMGIYVFAMFSNTIEHAGFPQLDMTEDYVELLFPPFMFYTVYALFARQRENELLQAERAAKRSREMMLEIVDTAPAGILVISADGHIVFANETAREVLDLVDDPDTYGLVHGAWTIRDLSRPVDSDPVSDLGAIVHGRARRDVPVRIEWPSGWSRELRVSVAPLADERDELGGAVVGFIDVQ